MKRKEELKDQSFNVHTYQLAATTPQAPSSLRMALWGQPEYQGMTANYAEIEFVESSKVEQPRFGKINPDVGRICIWFPIEQYERVAEILRNGTGVRCFYCEKGVKVPYAGIKDWNTKGGKASRDMVEPNLGVAIGQKD